MNAGILIDDALIHQVPSLTGANSPKEVVEIALKALIAKQSLDKPASAFEQHPREGNLDAM